MARMQRLNLRAVSSAAARGARRAMGYSRKKNHWMWWVGGAVALYLFVAPVKNFVNNLFTKKPA